MYRLLSERIIQKEAGWTKPLRATAYGISKDWSCFLELRRMLCEGSKYRCGIDFSEKRRFRSVPQAPIRSDYTGKGAFGQWDIVAKNESVFGQGQCCFFVVFRVSHSIPLSRPIASSGQYGLGRPHFAFFADWAFGNVNQSEETALGWRILDRRLFCKYGRQAW
jgi:hypothetical protein